MKGKRKATANPGLNGMGNDGDSGFVVGEQRDKDGYDENVENLVETEVEEEEEEEEDEEEGEVEEEEDGGQEERPKLDDGFFEIEAIRRKRKHKGQFQYLIKWRGWPETSNTWEPLENLQSCSDVLDAFEKSLRSGKSARKRKRKSGGPHTQPKKKQPRSSVGPTIMDVEIGLLPSTSLCNSFLSGIAAPNHYMGSDVEAENNGDVNHVKIARKTDENGSVYVSKQSFERYEDNEYDPKLSELRGTVSSNDANIDKPVTQFQEVKVLEADSHANGLAMVDPVDPVQSSRCIGSKRRKSGSVKRFKKDVSFEEPGSLQNPPSNVDVCYAGTPDRVQFENPNWSYSSPKAVGESAMNPFTITKIIKPISLSASVSDNVQNVVVTFVAMRSDGKEVIVDNSFLKANYPLLLINFYEQHLKYST